MRLLAIETAGKACSIALFDDDILIASRHETLGRGHAESLIPWIAELPGGGRADSILVGCGPGSFTGVRVGIAAARALGLGWGVPVAGMSSLALVVAGTSGALRILVAVEGGHGELFVQDFAIDPITAVSPLVSLTPAKAAAQFDTPHVVGSGAERLVAERGTGSAHPSDACAADALLLDLSLRRLPTTPIYGRNADARPMA
jgi:tRNA threonylcarbamoyladenosine biosynthesis protein TsaB